jgi:hypothetical protein
MFWNIRKQHLFASFISYSLQNIRTNLHTHIRFDAEQIHVEANTASKQIFASHVLILANIYFKICVLKHIITKL